MVYQAMRLSAFVYSFLILVPSLWAGDISIFNPCVGDWEGEFRVYSATGDKLDTQLWSWNSSSKRKGIQNIEINAKMKEGFTEHQNGFYLFDSNGMRRILKTDQGKLVSDLRGRYVGPGKFYWFYVDARGVLRESYLESVENGIFRIQGFRWDGVRAGSYRIIEAVFTQKTDQVKVPDPAADKASLK
jgi:hypothetical protein